MNANPGFAHDLLIELMSLREKKDLDAFFEKLYQFITEPISGQEFRNAIILELNYILLIMIEHFSNKEEFEKCAVIRNILHQKSDKV